MRGFLVAAMVAMAGNAAAEQKCNQRALARLDTQPPPAASLVASGVLDACPELPRRLQRQRAVDEAQLAAFRRLIGVEHPTSRRFLVAELFAGFRTGEQLVDECKKLLIADGTPAARAERIAHALARYHPQLRRPPIDDGVPGNPNDG
jgi:hypothetical protein